VKCNHEAEIVFAEKAMEEYGKTIMWAGSPQGVSGVLFMMNKFEYCPYCGEKIERTHGPKEN
jgi:hypothetical protein